MIVRRFYLFSLITMILAGVTPFVSVDASSSAVRETVIAYDTAPTADPTVRTIQIPFTHRTVVVRMPQWPAGIPRPWAKSSPAPRDPAVDTTPERSVGRPAAYETFTRTTMRVPQSRLPLHVYSDNPGAAGDVRRAVDAWNQTGRQLGVGTMFAVATSPGQADFTVSWSGQGLHGHTVGQTQMSYTRRGAHIIGVTMREYSTLHGSASEVLAHELGHVLGLGHSGARDDLMYPTAHGYPGYVRMSARDRQMLSWLYSRSDFVPIAIDDQPGASTPQ